MLKQPSGILTIAKTLEVIELKYISETSPRTVTIFTNSSNAINSLKNVNKHGYLMEEIRKRVTILERHNWTIEFSWVKAHIGINSKELADRLAKETARSRDRAVAFIRIPKNTLYSEREEEAKKLQNEWENCTKAAVVVTSSVILQLVTCYIYTNTLAL